MLGWGLYGSHSENVSFLQNVTFFNTFFQLHYFSERFGICISFILYPVFLDFSWWGGGERVHLSPLPQLLFFSSLSPFLLLSFPALLSILSCTLTLQNCLLWYIAGKWVLLYDVSLMRRHVLKVKCHWFWSVRVFYPALLGLWSKIQRHVHSTGI